MTFYNRYEDLCREHGYAPNGKTIRDFLGLRSSTISTWKNGAVPRSDKLRQISEFFSVSTDYLLGLTDERDPQNLFSRKQPEPSSESLSSSRTPDKASPPSDRNTPETSHLADGHSLIDVNADERFLIELFRSLEPFGRARILHAAMSEKENQSED